MRIVEFGAPTVPPVPGLPAFLLFPAGATFPGEKVALMPVELSKMSLFERRIVVPGVSADTASVLKERMQLSALIAPLELPLLVSNPVEFCVMTELLTVITPATLVTATMV
jgi:hypothetical protein